MSEEETTHCRPLEEVTEAIHPGPILILQRAGRVAARPLHDGEALVIGRSPAVHLPVDDPRMSRRHLQVYLSGTDVFVEDLRSTNGTYVDRKRLVGRQTLTPHSVVTAGDAVLRVQGLEAWRARCSSLADHETVEKALREAAERRGTVSLLAFRLPTGASLPTWSRRLVSALPGDVVLGHYSGTTLEAVCPRLDGPALEGRIRRLLAHTGASAGIATWPRPIATPEAMVSAALTALERCTPGATVHHASEESTSAFIADDPRTQSLLATVDRMADSHATVLVSGETGSGKEVVARRIHEQSPRSGPFIAVNCGAIAPTLLEAHLFGHEKGAFTGAEQARAGVFRDADGGTLFLDEVGDLPSAAQVALLRVLETRTVTPVGSTTTIPVDVRVVAASHRDLRAMADEGSFRWDLLYRLEVLSITVPALRERPRDIVPLAHHFLQQARVLHRGKATTLGTDTLMRLQAYAWPGNVRELRNVIERACVLAPHPVVQPEDLPERLLQQTPAPTPPNAASPRAPLDRHDPSRRVRRHDPGDTTEDFRLVVPTRTLAEHTESLEAAMLRRALHATGLNQSAAARRLQLPRRTLVYKLRRIDLDHDADEGDVMLAMLETSAEEAMPYRDRLAVLLQRLLVHLTTEQPDLDRLADTLGITPRTLRSKLPR